MRPTPFAHLAEFGFVAVKAIRKEADLPTGRERAVFASGVIVFRSLIMGASGFIAAFKLIFRKQFYELIGMLDRKPAYIAVFHRANGEIAGTGFTISEGLLLTCAHVVRATLGLGEVTPADPPDAPLTVKFPFHGDKGEFKAFVLPDGWFHHSSYDFSAGPLRDIAILAPAKGERAFPIGKPLQPGEWKGEAICFGFPSIRGGLSRKIHGRIDETGEIDDWLNFIPHLCDADTRAEIGGMSGSPVTREGVAAIGGMLPACFRDDKLIVRVIPGDTLIEAVAKARSVNVTGAELRALATRDRQGRIAEATASEWQMRSGENLPQPHAVAALVEILREAARIKANHLPENFPFRYLERRLAGLEKLTERDWPPEAQQAGEFIVDLAEFIAMLASSPHDMSEAIDACARTGRALGEVLETIKQPDGALYWNASDAPWPAGANTEVRRQATALIEASEPLCNEQGYRADAQTIEDHAETILAETERDPPHWTRMAESASQIGKVSATLKRAGAFPDLSTAASGLKRALCAASNAAIGALQPLKRFQELRFAPEMVVIPAGQFLMGSAPDEEGRDNDEGPQHQVTISKPFAAGRYLVTNAEWAAFCDKTGREKPEFRPERNRHPVTDVSWDDAVAYIAWLNDLIGGGRYRLMSEAEWEYCCRAGTRTRYFFGDEIRKDQANNGDDTTEVGAYSSNDFGLYDMHGNVREWVEDLWHDSYDEKPEELQANGGAWTTGDSGARVLRGGSWGYVPDRLRSAFRFGYVAGVRSSNGGFRLARTL